MCLTQRRCIKQTTFLVVTLGFAALARDAFAQDGNDANSANATKAVDASSTAAGPDITEVLRDAWSERGTFSGVAVDAQRNIYAIDSSPRCIGFDKAGKRLSQFYYAGETGGHLCAASSPTPSKTGLVLYGRKSLLRMHATNGDVLWDKDDFGEIEHVVTADLDVDGNDEVLVGYSKGSEGAGLAVLDHDGLPRWKYSIPGSPGEFATHICTGDVLGEKRVDVVAAFSDGSVRIFDADGKLIETTTTPLNFSSVGLARHPKSQHLAVLTAGFQQSEFWLVALDQSRNSLWATTLQDRDAHPRLALVCPEVSWMFVTVEENHVGPGVPFPPWQRNFVNRVAIISTETGRRLVTIEDFGSNPQFAWIPSMDGQLPLLLVATGGPLEAFAVDVERAKAMTPEKLGRRQ